MPFALLLFGLVFVVTGVKGTTRAMGDQLVKDFTGDGNFFYWFASIGAVGALGAVPEFRAFSRMFMTLIIVAMIIRNGGVFDKLLQAIKTGPVAPERTNANAAGSKDDANDLSGMLANPVSIGAAAMAKGAALAQKSIDTSRAQTSDPAKNASALTRLLGVFF